MYPRLLPDSFIITFKTPQWLRLSKKPRLSSRHLGKMYYIQHPCYGHIVKTLAEVHGTSYFFRGESEQSVSQSAIGELNDEHIIGRVIWVFSPKSTVIPE